MIGTDLSYIIDWMDSDIEALKLWKTRSGEDWESNLVVYIYYVIEYMRTCTLIHAWYVYYRIVVRICGLIACMYSYSPAASFPDQMFHTFVA